MSAGVDEVVFLQCAMEVEREAARELAVAARDFLNYPNAKMSRDSKANLQRQLERWQEWNVAEPLKEKWRLSAPLSAEAESEGESA